MQSRLLPPQTADEREPSQNPPQPTPARRTSDSKPIQDTPIQNPTVPAVATQPPQPPSPIAPQVSARPRGRFFVAAILLAFTCTAILLIWNTFLRDAAYGVVAGKTTAISPPWSGTLTTVCVRPGDTVRQGDVLAVVDDPELLASIDRLSDDMRAAQADLDAQTALLTLASHERGNSAEASRAKYYDLRGQLLAEQFRFAELSSKLVRRQELADRRAVSDEEIESLQFVKQGLQAKIENLEQAVKALETHLDTMPTSNSNAAQLKPWLTKIENYQSEIHRLREKQQRGTLRAPLDGTVVEMHCQVGEQANPTETLVELLPLHALELVLYVQQHQAETFQIGQAVDVLVDPATQPLTCEVTRIGERYEEPQNYIAGRYRPGEKLLPIYLVPPQDLPVDTKLRIGSTVRLPAGWSTFFGAAN